MIGHKLRLPPWQVKHAKEWSREPHDEASKKVPEGDDVGVLFLTVKIRESPPLLMKPRFQKSAMVLLLLLLQRGPVQ